MNTVYCPKHKVVFDESSWCPMCLVDEFEREMKRQEEEIEEERINTSDWRR